MSTLVEDIKELVVKYGFDTEPHTLKKLNFRADLLDEELYELKYAIGSANAEEVVDSLIDISVVALATLAAFNVNIQEAWDEVHRANMSKERGTKVGREHSGGFDLVKPKGWQGPNHCNNIGSLQKTFGLGAHVE